MTPRISPSPQLTSFIERLGGISKNCFMFRDFDYIKTKDGIIFIVRGDYHSVEKIKAAAVYFPSKNGDRVEKLTKNGYIKKIEEVPLEGTLIARLHPEYVPREEELIRNCSMVDAKDIVQHYKPREKTKECLEKETLKGTKWEALILSIHKIAQIPIEDIGIYGSLLVGLDKDDSDVDMLVYGEENLKRLRANFDSVLRNAGVNKANEKQRLLRIKEWKKTSKHSLIDSDKLWRIETRKWSRVNVYGDDITCIRSAYKDDEIKENPITTQPIREIKAYGVVLDSFRTHFSPRIAKVRINNRIFDVVSYLFLFFSSVFDNDEVEIFGNYRKDGGREYITLDKLEHYICPII